MYLGVFRPAQFVFEDFFGVRRRTDAEETISSQIIVCIANLSIPGRFFEPLSTFLRIILVYNDTLMPRRRFILNLSVPTTRKEGFPRKPRSQKMFLWFCSAFHLESRGMALDQLLASGYTGCTLACSTLACGFTAADSKRTIGFLLRFPAIWREQTSETTCRFATSTHHEYPEIKGARQWATKGTFFAIQAMIFDEIVCGASACRGASK